MSTMTFFHNFVLVNSAWTILDNYISIRSRLPLLIRGKPQFRSGHHRQANKNWSIHQWSIEEEIYVPLWGDGSQYKSLSTIFWKGRRSYKIEYERVHLVITSIVIKLIGHTAKDIDYENLARTLCLTLIAIIFGMHEAKDCDLWRPAAPITMVAQQIPERVGFESI